MHIEIPKDAELLAKEQAEAAGFGSVDEYITSLIRRRSSVSSLSRDDALADLKRLRLETPELSSDAIVEFVAEARAELL